MVNASELADDEMTLLGRAWPDGVPDQEITLLRSLTAPRRSKVMARLGALLDIEDARQVNPNAQVDMRGKALMAGLTADGLFGLRRKWEAARSLASIAPYLGRAERQPTQRLDDDPIVIAARALIADEPGSPDSVLASRLRKDFGASVPNMIRLVRRLRRDDATDPARVGKTFGRSLLVDLCAIDYVTVARPVTTIVCAVVVERTSGLILGHAVEASDGDTVAAESAAVRAAIAFVTERRLDVDGVPSEIELTIGDGPRAPGAFASAQRIRCEGVDLRVNSVGPRRYGQRLVSQLGKRLGRLWWRPRSSAPGCEPPPSDWGNAIAISDAAVMVAVEVDGHNAETLASLAQGGVFPGWGMAEGAMVSSLRRLLGVLGDS
ncbi:hypothetical protein ACLBWH_00760 [Sphingomonas sp. M6A6_1c]